MSTFYDLNDECVDNRDLAKFDATDEKYITCTYTNTYVKDEDNHFRLR